MHTSYRPSPTRSRLKASLRRRLSGRVSASLLSLSMVKILSFFVSCEKLESVPAKHRCPEFSRISHYFRLNTVGDVVRTNAAISQQVIRKTQKKCFFNVVSTKFLVLKARAPRLSPESFLDLDISEQVTRRGRSKRHSSWQLSYKLGANTDFDSGARQKVTSCSEAVACTPELTTSNRFDKRSLLRRPDPKRQRTRTYLEMNHIAR